MDKSLVMANVATNSYSFVLNWQYSVRVRVVTTIVISIVLMQQFILLQ